VADLAEQLQTDAAAEDGPAGTPETPAEFAGAIGIEWPAGDIAAMRILPGYRVAPYDADGPITTVESFTLIAHASATGIIWAEVTLFTDAAGRPVLRDDPDRPAGERVPWLTGDGELRTGTFPFLVTSMRVRES
jgi:hypothetical protein